MRLGRLFAVISLPPTQLVCRNAATALLGALTDALTTAMYRIHFILDVRELLSELKDQVRMMANVDIASIEPQDVQTLQLEWFRHRLHRHHFLITTPLPTRSVARQWCSLTGYTAFIDHEPHCHRRFYWVIQNIINRFPSLLHEPVEVDISHGDLTLRFRIAAREIP